MESRFRKFIIGRRDKATKSIVESNPSEAPQHQSSQRPLPATVQASIPRISIEHHIRIEGNGLQAVPYDVVAAGKTPVFTSTPVRGNGPIKLQTCRRLSTGELLPTTQDSNRTMKDIQEGDYIVGRKERRSVRVRPKTATAPDATPALSTSQSYSESSDSPRTPPETSASPWSPSLNEQIESSTHQYDESHSGLRILSNNGSFSPTHSAYWRSSTARLTLHSRSSCVSATTSPSVHTADEQNATIAALLKAESNRLADLFGRENSGSIKFVATPMIPTTPRDPTVDSASEPLSPPSLQQFGTHTQRFSNASTGLSQYHEDNSDTSSYKRASLISSIAGSSYTMQSSTTDHDVVTTRDDIRKLVEEMRSTYIRAIETQTPPIPKQIHTTKKKKRFKHGVIINGARVKSTTLASERQTWHGNNTQKRRSHLKGIAEARATSQPVTDLALLSTIEASPPQHAKRPTVQLQRADSSTLGSIRGRLEKRYETAELQPSTIPLHPDSDRRHAAVFDFDHTLDGVNLSNNDYNLIDKHLPPFPQTYPIRPIGNFI